MAKRLDSEAQQMLQDKVFDESRIIRILYQSTGVSLGHEQLHSDSANDADDEMLADLDATVMLCQTSCRLLAKSALQDSSDPKAHVQRVTERVANLLMADPIMGPLAMKRAKLDLRARQPEPGTTG
jgi:hypothetical protein